MRAEQADRAARAILRDLEDRSGMDSILDEMYASDKEEMVEHWAYLIFQESSGD